ncbi:MAG: hydrogenase nickel incorporation protein HypA [Spirochaetia bacterium]|jgi:hydrogenase nickel incorporation protein HypA/HybF
MHEWALADAVIEATSSALAGRNPTCLRAVTVTVGELQAIDHEIFRFALNTLLEERPFRTAVYKLETEPARFLCGACEREWSLAETRDLDDQTREAIHFLPEAAHAFVRCPSCKSPDYRVKQGRGVSIASISLDTSESCA